MEGGAPHGIHLQQPHHQHLLHLGTQPSATDRAIHGEQGFRHEDPLWIGYHGHVGSMGGLTDEQVLDPGAGNSDVFGAMFIHMVACGGHPQAIAYAIIRWGLNAFKATDAFGNTALHFAAAKGDARVVHMLIGCGVPVEDTNERGLSAAHHAARGGHVEVLRVLHGHEEVLRVQHGRWPELLSNQSNEGITVVHVAAKNCHLATLRFLWEVVPHVFEVQDQNGCTAAHWAAADGNLAVAKFLRERVPQTMWTQDMDGFTPADYAELRGRLGMTNFCNDPVTPLMHAAREGNTAEVLGLLGRGADPTLVLNGSTRSWVPTRHDGVWSSTSWIRCRDITGPTNGHVDAVLEDGTVVEKVPWHLVRPGQEITVATLVMPVLPHHDDEWEHAHDELARNTELGHGEGFSAATRDQYPEAVRTRMLVLAMALKGRMDWPDELWFRLVAALYCLFFRNPNNMLNWQRPI
jgi:hypothetical protein